MHSKLHSLGIFAVEHGPGYSLDEKSTAKLHVSVMVAGQRGTKNLHNIKNDKNQR